MEQSQAVEIRSKQIQSDIALTRALGGGYASEQTTQ
jgi:outer membrane protein TolC